jgi:hypothetical protein
MANETYTVELKPNLQQRRKKKGVIAVDTSGIEPDTFRKAPEVRSERDKPTTPCAPNHLGHPMQSGPEQRVT